MQLKVGFRSMFPRDTDLISFLLLKERGDFDTYWITLGQRARPPFNQIQQLFFFLNPAFQGHYCNLHLTAAACNMLVQLHLHPQRQEASGHNNFL